jgi:hypothetical protein
MANECTLRVDVVVSWWVHPIILAAIMLNRITGHPANADSLITFITRHGVKMLVHA